VVQRVCHPKRRDGQKILLAVIARFKAFKKRVPSYSNSKRPQRASASKAKSSVLSQLSGLKNVVFNDFIDDALDSEDVSEQRASASLPDSVPIEPGAARTILLFNTISARPPKQPRMVRTFLKVHTRPRHCGAEVTESSTNKQHHLSSRRKSVLGSGVGGGRPIGPHRLGSGPRGSPPLGWYFQQVTLLDR
jgi:hypothetical protein